MKRNIRIERLYTLGDFKNIKICDEIVDIPVSIMQDPKKVGIIYTLLTAGCDLAYYQYEQMYKDHTQLGSVADRSKSIEYLESLIGSGTEQLNELFTNGGSHGSVEEG